MNRGSVGDSRVRSRPSRRQALGRLDARSAAVVLAPARRGNLLDASLVLTTTMKNLNRHTSTLAVLPALALLGACGAGTQMAALDREPPRRALDPSTCELDRYAPVTVRPHFESDGFVNEDFNPPPQLRGAEVFVPARPGLTAEWLWHELGARPGDARSCATGVAGAEISVRPGGPGFVVTIRGDNGDSGQQILRLARVDERAAPAGAVGAAP